MLSLAKRLSCRNKIPAGDITGRYFEFTQIGKMDFKRKLSNILTYLKGKFLKRKFTWGILFLLFVVYLFCLPKPLFNDPVCTVITDSDNKLLGAKIADDGQWRFPHSDQVPEKFEKSIICFEDQYFYKHPGINPVAMIRAAILDIKNRKVVSGGSTISMQVIRLARKNKPRTVKEKLIEVVLATRLELKYTKKEILAFYSSNAPFGGNVVGLEAASWRYYQRPANELSWAESATLAVLPNAPSLIFPGKNKDKLLHKRNFLLHKLLEKEVIDTTTYELSLLESLPEKPYPLPQKAYHLLMELYKGEGRSKITRTTIDSRLQTTVNNIVKKHAKELNGNEIYNVAAIVADVETGNVLAYVGNVDYQKSNEHGNQVNIITSPRSSGSILKPILFAGMLNDGDILPGTLVPDIPSNMTGFSPQNFNLKFDGAVPAKKALSRSLNIPAVRMLRKYSLKKFYYLLKQFGVSTLNNPPSYYGLSLILGGSEVTLWDMAGCYASLSRVLNHYNSKGGLYADNDIRSLNYFADKKIPTPHYFEQKQQLNAASIWLTYQSLLEVNRPSEEIGWDLFSSARKVAWKTGTSFGFRDAWSIGTTPEYVVAVWVGNATGEGRPGLTGVTAAAPILFDIFGKLPQTSWFDQPYEEMTQVDVCKKSGYRAGENCEETEKIWIPLEGLNSEVCPFHKIIHLDAEGKYQVKSSCYPVDQMIHKKWFVLPPVQEYYYKARNPGYKPLPPFRVDCSDQKQQTMELIYPGKNLSVYIPVELDGKLGKLVLEAVHKDPKAQIFWHLNDKYIGTTEQIHQMGISPEEGEYTVTLVDNMGNEITRKFEVYGRK